MNRFRLGIASSALLGLGLACSSSSSSPTPASGDGGSSSGSSGTSSGPGFDCAALRDFQVKSSCPKFDPAKYMTDCMATKTSVSQACQPKLDALANCLLAQSPPPCTEDGQIDDTIPAACKPQDDALQSCK